MTSRLKPVSSQKNLNQLTQIIQDLTEDYRQLTSVDDLSVTNHTDYLKYTDALHTHTQQLNNSILKLSTQLDRYPVANIEPSNSYIFYEEVKEDYSFFLWNLQREMERVRRCEYELILLSVRIINISDLKEKYSAATLGEVLNQITSILQQAARVTDIRWQNQREGRFILVLTDTQCAHSEKIRARIKQQFADTQFKNGNDEITVKVAIHFITQTSENLANAQELLEILG